MVVSCCSLTCNPCYQTSENQIGIEAVWLFTGILVRFPSIPIFAVVVNLYQTRLTSKIKRMMRDLLGSY
ncbi:hypothetical protein VNO77_21010 [Canavalia gladiata]|uniref:Uncharacterized protein n=1 Tax=Canavalia gladiata TaxID=3824 RepID=A0AAN9QR44_CANGL